MNTTHGKRPIGMAFTAALATASLFSLGLLGGVGFAADSVSANQYQYGGGKKKVTICHKGKTITVAEPALKAHKAHGDTEGPCATDARKGKQKGKGKGKPGSTEQQPVQATAGEKEKGKPDDPGKAKGKGK